MRAIERSDALKRDYRRIKASTRSRELDDRLTSVLAPLVNDRPLPTADRRPPTADRDHAVTSIWTGGALHCSYTSR